MASDPTTEISQTPAGESFRFLDPGPLCDRELSLLCVKHVPADLEKGFVPYYNFAMRVKFQTIGHLNLRIGNKDHILMQAGHIGYGVDPAHRGHHYAERAARLVLPLALRHGINPVWITCNPDNFPSRRTCERLGGQMIDIVAIPPDTDMYKRGDHFKCRYRIDL